jgi:hypothetical protein
VSTLLAIGRPYNRNTIRILGLAIVIFSLSLSLSNSHSQMSSVRFQTCFWISSLHPQIGCCSSYMLVIARCGEVMCCCEQREVQVPEADDKWDEIQDAQDAVALRALWELMPTLTQEYQLRPALRFALLHASNLSEH